MSEQKTVALSDIIESPVALRTVDEESERFQEIVDSVRAEGILNPPNAHVDQSGSGKFILIDGLHRYLGAKRAGLTEIPLHILEVRDDVHAQELQLIANYHKVDTKPVQYAEQIKKILAAHPLMTLIELSGKLNTNTTWISERLNLLKLSPDIQALVDEGKIGLTNAYLLAKLPDTEQNNFVDRAMTDAPAQFGGDVKARVKEINTANREGRAAEKEIFTATAHMRKPQEVKDVNEDITVIASMLSAAGITDPVEAAALVLKWVLHLDDDSVEEARAKWEARKASLEEAKARKKEEREAKKKEKAETEATDTAASLLGVKEAPPVTEGEETTIV